MTGQLEIRVVQQVVKLAAQIEFESFGNWKFLRQRQIDRLHSIAAQSGARRIAESELRGSLECLRCRTSVTTCARSEDSSGLRSRLGRRGPAEKALVVLAAVTTVNGGPLCIVVNNPKMPGSGQPVEYVPVVERRCLVETRQHEAVWDVRAAQGFVQAGGYTRPCSSPDRHTHRRWPHRR